MHAAKRLAALTLALAAAAHAETPGPALPLPAAAYDVQAEFARDLPAKRKALAEIRDRLVARPPNVSPEAKDAAKVRSYFDHLTPAGTFDDVAPPPPASWATGLHRLNAMAAAYAAWPKDQQAAQHDRLMTAIAYYAREMVAKPDPFTGGAFLGPRDAAAIYFSLYPHLQPPEAAATREALRDAIEMAWYYPVNGDDSRKTDPHRLGVFTGDPHFTVGNFTYRSVVECAVVFDDTQRMDVVAAITKLSLANVTSWQTADQTLWGGAGLQADGNAMAHGRQSYLFGYDKDWLYGVTAITDKLKGTPWQIGPGRWDRAADMLLDGMQWYVYKNDLDWSVNGRHNVYPGPIGDPDKTMLGAIKRLSDVSAGALRRDTEVKALEQRLKAKQELAGNRWYWSAEDMVHRRGDYYLSVNLTSVRSNGPEVAAPYSVVNYHFPFGTMCIKARGDEYLLARGALNYAALPGLTADPTLTPPTKDNWDGYHGDNTFCGGVSDGDVGACGFVLSDPLYHVAGHKSYFFFDGGCVALGSGLTTGTTETTINQTQWRGETTYADVPATLPTTGVHADVAVDRPTWFLNDGTGYVVLPGRTPTHVKVVAENRATRWPELAKVNAGKSGAESTEVPVFQLSIPHPAGQDGYAYAVLPNATAESLKKTVADLPFTVLANDAKVQAVRFADGTVQAVFFEAAALDGPVKLAVDRPAVVMLRPADGGSVMHVADPMQTVPAAVVNVTFTLPGASRSRTLRCPLPDRPLTGKPARFTLPNAG